MNQKTLTIMGVAAAAVVAGAILVSPRSEQGGDPAAPATREKFVPGLLDKANDVARVEVTAGAVTFATFRDGDTWRTENLAGYPANMESVRKTILDVANMERVEPKTSNPDNFGALDLREPSSEEGNASKLVRLKDASGSELAAVILGKAEYSAYDKPHQYVRKAGENQTWLVSGLASPPIERHMWSQRVVVDIPQERIKTVEFLHQDNEKVRATRTAAIQREFTLETMPEGRELKNSFMATDFARALGTINLDDVGRFLELELPPIPAVTNTIETFDGLKILVAHYTKDDKHWATFIANADETVIDEENARRQKEADEANEQLAAEAAGGDENAPKPPAVTPDLIDKAKVVQEAADLNARWEGWAYQLPTFVRERLTRRNEYYLKEPPAPAEPEEPADSTDAPAEDPMGAVIEEVVEPLAPSLLDP